MASTALVGAIFSVMGGWRRTHFSRLIILQHRCSAEGRLTPFHAHEGVSARPRSPRFCGVEAERHLGGRCLLASASRDAWTTTSDAAAEALEHAAPFHRCAACLTIFTSSSRRMHARLCEEKA